MADKLKVRLVENTKDHMYWYEELIGEQWVKIPSTYMASKGNADYNLEKHLDKKREERYRIYNRVLEEKEFSIDI